MVAESRSARLEVKELQAHLATLRDKFSHISPSSALTTSQSSSTPSAASTPSSSSASAPPAFARPKVKLGAVQIPKFNGNVLDYPQFKATFNALTEDQGYKAEVILIYLRDCLPKEVQHLLLGIKDMAAAWGRLDDRFGNLHLRSLAIY